MGDAEPLVHGAMQLTVKSLTGSSKDVEVNETDTIVDIKKKLGYSEPAQVRLVFSGRQLDDEQTVGDAGR